MLKLHPELWAFVLRSESTEEEHFEDMDVLGKGEVACSLDRYQIASRNPLYCKAETSCLWELAQLELHYHPSVQAFSRKLAGVSIFFAASPNIQPLPTAGWPCGVSWRPIAGFHTPALFGSICVQKPQEESERSWWLPHAAHLQSPARPKRNGWFVGLC